MSARARAACALVLACAVGGVGACTPAGADYPLSSPAVAPVWSPPALPDAPVAAQGGHAFRNVTVSRDLGPEAPATQLAGLGPEQCKEALASAGLPVARSKSPSSGVDYAVRVTGAFGGVDVVTASAPSPFGLMDCRLAFALSLFADVLADRGVTSVRIDNIYRPHAHIGGGAKPSQHALGLALDITSVTLADGRSVRVEDHWNAPIGATVCGPDAVMEPVTEESVLLRDIVCESARRGLFHHMLTPSYDAAHRNHFHFDIKRDTAYRSVR